MIRALVNWLRFNLWYFRQPPWDTQLTPPELKAFAAETAAGRALDLGCGTGTNMVFLAQAGWQVSGVDFALKAVEAARQRLKRAGLGGQVQAGDVTRLDVIRGPFDLVLDIGCYHSIDQPGRARYQESLRRLVAPGGAFLIYAHLKAAPEAEVGLDEGDIGVFSAQMRLAWRSDSFERSGRKAVWMRFER